MNLVLSEEMKVNPRASGNIAARERRGGQLHTKKSFALLDFAPDATLVLDQQGIIVWSNARASELLGRSSHELVEAPILSIIPDLPVALFPFDVHSFFQDPTHHRAGHRNILKAGRKDGEVALDITFSRLDQNNQVYTWATLREAINLPEAEAQSPKTQTYDRSLIEASLDPQISNGPDGIITDVNEAMVQVTGVQRENLTGTPFPQYFTEPRKAEEAYQQALYKGMVRNYTLSFDMFRERSPMCCTTPLVIRISMVLCRECLLPSATSLSGSRRKKN